MKYTELSVWQASMDLAQSVFALTDGFPVEQRFVLASQMQRSEQTDKVGRMLSKLTTSLKGR